MTSQDQFEAWAAEHLPTLYLTKTDQGTYESTATGSFFAAWSARDGEIERLRGENQRLLAGVESDLAEIDRIQSVYDAHFRKTRAYRMQRDQAKDESAKLKAENEALRKDAERYRWFRNQHWDGSAICAVVDPKQSTKLGAYCPSEKLLDETIDAALTMSKEASHG